MSNDIQVFNFEENNQIRVLEKDGNLWFVAKDVCNILEIKNARDAVNRLKDYEKMTVGNSDSHSGQRGGAQFLNIINESGLYKLAFRSNKPQAEKCPFCGSEAEFGYYRDEEGIDYGCMYCNGCGAKITWDYGDEEDCVYVG